MKSSNITILPITPQHDSDICNIIQKVGWEFGAIGDGFGPSDDEVLAMSKHYCHSNRSQYFVALLDGQVVGGSGIAPFDNKGKVCELRKLFILPNARGFGIGKALTEKCLEYAYQQKFTHCYLDTLANMHNAIKLYESLNFKQLKQPMAGTIHNGCDVWMLKAL